MLEHCTLQDEKDNSFHKKVVKEVKVDSTTYNIQVHLTRMITHGLMIGIFGHFELPFLDTSSNFNVSYLTLCLRMLEDPMVDDFGNFLYEKGSLIFPLHVVILQNESYNKSQEYKRKSMQALSIPIVSLNKLLLILFLQLANCGCGKKMYYLFFFQSIITTKNIY